MYYRTLAKRVGNAVRLAEVIQVLVKHGFADLVHRAGLHEGVPAKLLRGLRIIDAPSPEPETLGRRLRSVLTELGPTFIKFGQVLSTRPDLLGANLCAELNLLQDKVDSLPFDKMEPVLYAALGKTASELFESFDPVPVASASLSQVYKASLKGGRAVAVKLQRPGVRAVVESDLSLLRGIAEWITEHVAEMRWVDPGGAVDEFARSIRRELDFSIEMRVIQRFARNYEGNSRIVIPRTYPELSGAQVLTMEWIDGARVDALDQYAARNCDPKRVAEIGCETLCQQVFEFNFFHADPHPGNIWITRNNRIAFLDYGMVGHLEDKDVATIADLLRAVFEEDAVGCVDALLRFTTAGDVENRDALAHEVADYIAFEAQVILSGGRVGQAIERLTEVLRRNHLELAPRFSLLLKALATIEATGRALVPGMDMAALIKPYAERMILERYAPMRLLDDTRQNLGQVLGALRDLPGDLHGIMRMLRRGRLRMQVNHEGLNYLAGVTDRASNRIAFGVITGSLIIGSSMLITAGENMRKVGLAGYLVAGLLGLALAISILRSRNY